jgi:hypothetical protein
VFKDAAIASKTALSVAPKSTVPVTVTSLLAQRFTTRPPAVSSAASMSVKEVSLDATLAAIASSTALSVAESSAVTTSVFTSGLISKSTASTVIELPESFIPTSSHVQD